MTLQNGDAGITHPDDVAAARQRWDELPRWQQAGIVGLGAVEVVLTVTALVDLVRRPGRQVRGPKALWALGCGVQPFGPIAYLVLGRRRARPGTSARTRGLRVRR